MIDKSYWSRNMYRLSLLFFFFFKFAGLATFSLNNQANLNKNSENIMFFISSKLGIFYNLFGSCLIILLGLYSIQATIYLKFVHKTDVICIIEIFQIILGSFVIISTLLFYCIFESVIVKIGNYLINIENVLRRLQQPLNRRHIFNILFLICLFILILFITLLITEIKLFNSEPVIKLMGDFIPLVFVGLLFIQYFFVLNLIYVIFVKLNCIIQSFCRSRCDDINLKILNQTQCVFMSYSRIHLFIQIRNIYDHLCDICREVSDFYSFSILTALSFIFLVILYNLYYLFLLFNDEETNFLLITNTIIWIILPLSLLALLTSKVTKVINEVGRFEFFFFFFF